MYLISDFEGVNLPKRMGHDDLSTGVIESSLTPALGTVFDLAGASRRLPRVQQIQASGLYSSVEGDLLTQVTVLKALIGVRGSLWRTRDSDSVRQWKTARLLSVNYRREAEDAGEVADVDANFETAHVGWRADALTTVSQGGTSFVVTVANGGDLPVHDAVIQVTANAAISSLGLAMTDVDINYSGALNGGETLIIDCGALTVRVGSADRYQYFSLGSGHHVDPWLPLATGDNALSITADGNVTVSVEFYEQYA